MLFQYIKYMKQNIFVQNIFVYQENILHPFSRTRMLRNKVCFYPEHRTWANGDRLLGIETGWRWRCKSLTETRKYLRGKPVFSDYSFLILEKLWVQFIMLSVYLANQHVFPHNTFLTSYVGKIIWNSPIKIIIISMCWGWTIQYN